MNIHMKVLLSKIS